MPVTVHAEVVLQGLLDVKKNPVWSAIVLAATESRRNPARKYHKGEPRRNSLYVLEKRHVLRSSLLAAAKEVYAEWLVTMFLTDASLLWMSVKLMWGMAPYAACSTHLAGDTSASGRPCDLLHCCYQAVMCSTQRYVYRTGALEAAHSRSNDVGQDGCQGSSLRLHTANCLLQEVKQPADIKSSLHETQAEAKAAAKKAKKQRQKAARQQTQLAQRVPPTDHAQQEPQAQQHSQENQHAQQAQQLDQDAQQPQQVQHGAAGHDQPRAAQSLTHCNDATGPQPAQTCGSPDHDLSASLDVNQSERPSTGNDLEASSLEAAVETNASQTDGYLCDEASAALFLQQLICCPLTQVRLRTHAPFSS